MPTLILNAFSAHGTPHRWIIGEERTGKGGHYWVYKAAMDEAGFKRFMASTLLESLMRDFPEATRTVVQKLIV